MKRLHPGGVVAHAARKVSVVEVLQQFGVEISESPLPGTTIKTWCPFGDLHPDGGIERHLRVYGDGKCFCHVCQRMYDSVSMAAQKWGVNREMAARRLLSDRDLPFTDTTIGPVPISPQRLRSGALAALGVWADAHSIDRFSERYLLCVRQADVIEAELHVEVWLDACKNFLAGRTQHA